MRLDIGTPDDLGSLLKCCLIPTKRWGQEEAKTVKDLFQEIEAKKCTLSLQEGKLTRQVRLTAAYIPHWENPELYLHVGRDLPGGVILDSEGPSKGMTRELDEKIGVIFSEYTDNKVEKEVILDSPSYPGLITVSHIYKFWFNAAEQLSLSAFSHPDRDGTMIEFDWLPLDE